MYFNISYLQQFPLYLKVTLIEKSVHQFMTYNDLVLLHLKLGMVRSYDYESLLNQMNSSTLLQSEKPQQMSQYLPSIVTPKNILPLHFFVIGAFERTRSEFGGIDLVVNNAGIGGFGLFSKKWKLVIDIDLVCNVKSVNKGKYVNYSFCQVLIRINNL